MHSSSFFPVLLSLALWKLVQAGTPTGGISTQSLTNNSVTTTNKPNIGTSQTSTGAITDDDIFQLMGNVQPQNCRQTKNSWSTGQPLWGNVPLADNYRLYQNVWSSGSLQSGSSNDLTCRAFSGGVLSWSVKFKMDSVSGSQNQVKSYSNACWYGNPKRIADLQVFNSEWRWKLSQTSSDLVADVAYDIFTANDGSCKEQTCASTEIMIWLAAIGGALPSSSTGKAVGSVQIRGDKYLYTFDVWKGVVSNKPVISLIPSKNAKYTFFSADLKALFKLLEPYGLSQNQYVVNVGAGTEVFHGSGSLDTSKYVLNIKSKDGSKRKHLSR